ncbi:type VII secretion-associated serine protease mycosin [Asanoa ferruginea]|uniref:Type VII secretion-associated serine protease mycosin n=1 Tax=Asanoa ferruginea TaxID=53367 RepID=A0A3D9ZFQ2_9ACTN|nr:type VII secretion-associated serine protease mycosin [Asanoa ferruginea]REF96121.1 type VII secretion-associated serine protease mycosin [Asanoa ferruginea]
MTQTPWPLQQMRPDLAWPISEGAGITVAVIDSGVSATHPALAGRVLQGRDFLVPSTRGQCDEAAHGTIVAGVIAGQKPEGSVFTGIAPKAKILPIRVLKSTGKEQGATPGAHIVSAIDWAVGKDVDVINLSLTTDPTPALERAIKNALDHGVVVVAAAGNDGGSNGTEQSAYPAAYDGVIAVAGIDKDGHHVATSTSGAYVDVAAPGADVDGPIPHDDGYLRFTEGGTSFAAAYVSGLAALLRSANPKLTPAQVLERITTTADHPPEGRNNQVGYGVINPYRALTAIPGASKPSPAPQALAPVTLPKDPMGNTRVIATWTATALAGVALVIALVAAVLRRTRRRGLPVDGAAPALSAGRASKGRGGQPSTAQVTAPKVRSRGGGPARAGAMAGSGSAQGQPAQRQPSQHVGSHATSPNFSGRAQVPPR